MARELVPGVLPLEIAVGGSDLAFTCRVAGRSGGQFPSTSEVVMKWEKPEFEVVDVTMEVTAYVARR